MKKCNKCGELLPLSMFTKNVSSKDGLSYYCKDCDKAIKKIYVSKNIEKIRAYKAKWRSENRESCRKLSTKWQKSHRARCNELNYISRKRNPKTQQARHFVFNQILKGTLIRQPCEICGEIKSEAHHYLGYEEKHWLDVQWLCVKHHNEANINLKKETLCL